MLNLNKENIIQLTNKIYRITLLFPKKEPLRYKTREIADDILADLIIYNNSSNPEPKQDLVFNIKNNLEIINSYFEIAKYQNWASYFDILELERGYKEIGDKIEENKELSKKQETDLILMPEPKKSVSRTLEKEVRTLDPVVKKSEKLVSKTQDNSQDIKDREKKILDILKQKGKMQVYQISRIFPQVSKRTIRRDFVQLLEKGLIERIGQKNYTFYQVKQQ